MSLLLNKCGFKAAPINNKVSDGSDHSYVVIFDDTKKYFCCGLPYALSTVEASTNSQKEQILYPNEASNSMTKVGGGEDLLSVTYWISQGVNNYPIVCAYAGKDSIVGVNQFATLQTALDNMSIEYELFYFKNSNHTDITAEADATAYNGFVNKIDQWGQSKTL